MKHIHFRPALAAVALVCLTGIVSCKDYLDVTPTAFSTPAEIFSNVDGARSAVYGVYDILSGDPTYGIRLNLYYPYDSDEMQSSQGGTDAGSGRRGIARYTSVKTNAEVLNPWNALYQGIERANGCIKYIPEMAQYNSTPELKRLHGEALTLRAQFYFELVRNWGDVPEPRTASITGQDFKIPRTDRNEIYDHLLADLQQAATLVPWRSAAGTNNERITKGSVKALRARIALYRGGYSLGQDGNVTRPSNYRDFYTIARDECAELMANRSEHTLNPSFEEIWRSINEQRREASANEIMFEVGAAGGSAASDSKLGYYNGPRCYASPTYGTSSGAVTALPTYFYAFDSLDTRRDITLAPYTVGNSSNSNDLQYATTLVNVYDGKFRRDWRTPPVSTANVQNLGYNWPLIRFADVLLMYAETENELNGPANATAALREVRLRAFGNNPANIGPIPTNKADFFTAIMKERFLEFGGEGIRKYDLIRWNLLGTNIIEAKAQLRLMLDQTAGSPYANIPLAAFYTVVNGKIRWARSLYRPAPATTPAGTTRVNWRSSITQARIDDIASAYNVYRQLLPIPQVAIENNKNLNQNPGY